MVDIELLTIKFSFENSIRNSDKKEIMDIKHPVKNRNAPCAKYSIFFFSP